MSKKVSDRRIDYVIGDVHGCFAELSELIVKICEDAWSEDAQIHLWFIGDLIDKGPSSSAVLDMVFLQELDGITMHSIMGNHEEKFVRWCQGQAREEAGGAKNGVKDRWGFPELREYEGLVKDLPIHATLPEYGVVLIHGGVEPRMESLPPTSLSEANKHQKNILRVRYVSEDGRMIPLGEEDLDKSDKWWADVYDGRFGTVIYGHQPHDEVAYHAHAIGIDTGCVFGNKLTALRLSADGNHKVISVKAKEKYAKSYTEEKFE